MVAVKLVMVVNPGAQQLAQSRPRKGSSGTEAGEGSTGRA